MTKIIEVLRDEHRNIEKLLVVLEQELAVFDRRERPDYEILHATIDYFQEFPDRCHHPKEDLIFTILKARDPAAAETVGDLQGDHRKGSQRLQRLAQVVTSILTDHDLLRQSVDAVVHDFVDSERVHMQWEERLFFPAALKALQPEDWAEIDAKLNDTKDPLFVGPVDKKFRSLQRRIVGWEIENEKGRAPSRAAKTG
jgi:hemerythrin-like domain-containing protein